MDKRAYHQIQKEALSYAAPFRRAYRFMRNPDTYNFSAAEIRAYYDTLSPADLEPTYPDPQTGEPTKYRREFIGEYHAYRMQGMSCEDICTFYLSEVLWFTQYIDRIRRKTFPFLTIEDEDGNCTTCYPTDAVGDDGGERYDENKPLVQQIRQDFLLEALKFLLQEFESHQYFSLQ